MLPSDRVFVTSPTRIGIKPTVVKSSSLRTMPRYCSSSGLHSAGWTSIDPRTCLRLSSSSPKERKIRAGYNEAHIQVDHLEGSDSKLKKFSRFVNTSWRFIRPFSLLYFACGAISIATRVWTENAHLVQWSTPLKGIMFLIAMCFAPAGFVSGINQIYDIESDKINKPDLPLASEDISVKYAWVMTISFAVGGLLIVLLNKMGPAVTSNYCLTLLMGVLYSVPPFRLKRFTASAMFIIVVARILFNFGIYHASRICIGLPFEWSPSFGFIVLMTTMNALVCSITKDISDIEGDRMYGVHTLASKVGARSITFVGTGLQLLSYVAAICTPIFMPQAFKRSTMIPAHAVMALILIYKAWKLEKANYGKEASEAFYMVLWKLTHAEYIIFPFI